MLLTKGVQNPGLDGLMTLIAITHGKLGELISLTRTNEGEGKNFDIKRSTASWNKIRELRHTLIRYLFQQNRFGTGEDKTL